jgi:hypothetical protein
MEELDHSALSERYRSLTDEELLRLVDRRAELVPVAQLALDQEARRRRAWLEPLRQARSRGKIADDVRLDSHVSKSIRCHRCDREMKEGFILDATHGARLVSRWVSGKPEASFWTGTKVDGREQYFVQAFRCVACGYLESYANES